MPLEKIVKQFSKCIFPFRYNAEKSDLSDKTIMSAKGKGLPVFIPFSQSASGLRQGLDGLLSKDGGSAQIGHCYRLNDACRTAFGLSKRADEILKFYARQSGEVCYDVSIKNIELFLFESGVGFISMETEYASPGMKDYIDCNYFISEIKSDKNYFVATQYEWNEETKAKTPVESKFTLKELLDKALSFVDGVQSIEKRSKTFTDEKGIVYSYVLFDKEPDNFRELLFLLRRNYKGSYKAPHDGNGETDSTNIRQLFENSFWATSLNAAVNVSFLTGDKTTDSFFSDDLFVKMHDTYFFLFINVLHQRYAVMKFMGEMGTLDKLEKDYAVMKSQLKQAKAFHAEATNLKFRAFFLIPSNVEHINIYYKLLCSAFRIQELYRNFNDDIKTLKDICNTYVSRIKERDEKISKRRKIRVGIFVSIFGSIVAIASLLNSYWSILERALGKEISFWSAPVLLFIGLIAVPVVTLIVDSVNQIKDMYKITEDLEGEIRDNLVESDKLRRRRKIERLREEKRIKKEKKNDSSRKY